MRRPRTWQRFPLPQPEILEHQRPIPAPQALDGSIEIDSSHPVGYTIHDSTMKQKRRHRSTLLGIVVVASFVSFFQYRRFFRRELKGFLFPIVGTPVAPSPDGALPQ